MQFPPWIYLPNMGFSQKAHQKFTGTSERLCCSAADLDPRQLAPGCFRSRYHIPCIRSKSLYQASSKTLPTSSALTGFRTFSAAWTVGQKVSGVTETWPSFTFLAQGSSLEEDHFQELFPCPLTWFQPALHREMQLKNSVSALLSLFRSFLKSG